MVVDVVYDIFSIWFKGRNIEGMLVPSRWSAGCGPGKIAFLLGLQDHEVVILVLVLRDSVETSHCVCGQVLQFDSVPMESGCRVKHCARYIKGDSFMMMQSVLEVDEEFAFSIEKAEGACYKLDVDLRPHFNLTRPWEDTGNILGRQNIVGSFIDCCNRGLVCRFCDVAIWL